MTPAAQVIRPARGPLSDAVRERPALGVNCEAARALESRAALRQRFHVKSVMFDVALPALLQPLSQLRPAVEAAEDAAKRVANRCLMTRGGAR